MGAACNYWLPYWILSPIGEINAGPSGAPCSMKSCGVQPKRRTKEKNLEWKEYLLEYWCIFSSLYLSAWLWVGFILVLQSSGNNRSVPCLSCPLPQPRLTFVNSCFIKPSNLLCLNMPLNMPSFSCQAGS